MKQEGKSGQWSVVSGQLKTSSKLLLHLTDH
jgi:hypothetical protein